MNRPAVSLALGLVLVGTLADCGGLPDRPPPAENRSPGPAATDGGTDADENGGDGGAPSVDADTDAATTVSGTPIILATGQNVDNIALDQNNVYWTNWSGNSIGTVRAVSFGGGAPITLASNQTFPDAIAVDGTSVYWANQTAGQLMKVALAGGPPVEVAAQAGTAFYGVAVDATNVYWTSFDSVFKRPLVGGAAVTLASGQLAAGDVVVDATNVYWRVSQALMKVPIEGGTPTMVTAANSPQRIAIDAASIYWTEADAGTVKKVALTGGAPTTLASGQDQPSGIAVDATNVYWVTFFGGTVMRAPIGGGTATMLASKESGPAAIAVSATRIVWGTFASGNSDGHIAMLSK